MKNILIKVQGIVQGVGFRPFVHRLAVRYGINGSVRNTSGSVIIEASGGSADLKGFIKAIRDEKPVSSDLKSVSVIRAKGRPFRKGFRIMESSDSTDVKFVPPDIRTCGKCLSEFSDTGNRRYHYPFINCTECGPRFTIIKDTPYDRKNTTMSGFEMCPDCAAEYSNMDDRRYHAEPNACPVCGPRAWLAGKSGVIIEKDTEKVFIEARKLLKKGKILAVKGLGGFHIAADAANAAAVLTLKKRKHRSNKPFAVMASSLDAIRRHAETDEYSEGLLKSREAPVVLLKSREESRVSANAAPGLKHIGFFLPYTPLHYLLFDDGLETLIMTSANMAEEPIQHDNGEALAALAGIADFFIMHDRPINIPADDSVIKPYGKKQHIFIRRSRGYVPVPITIKNSLQDTISTGALLKNTACFVKSGQAFMSQHIGDLENKRAYDYFKETVYDFTRFYGIKPSIIACDRHPDYLSARFAEEYAEKNGIPVARVQHHYAHMLSVMAEHGHNKKVIGIIMDGTGYGDDGNTWGGEFLVGGFNGYKRAAHLKYIKLPGGNLASEQGFRTAAGILSGFLNDSVIKQYYRSYNTAGVLKALKSGVNTPLSSGAGRLFDAAASILGICHVSTYDAEAPMRLEAAATGVNTSETYGYDIITERRPYIIDMGKTFKQLWKNKNDTKAAANFHLTFAAALADTASIISSETGIRDIVLSGGVFQNTVLLQMILKKLQKKGFNVLMHKMLPPNDGSIALGQAAYAAHLVTKSGRVIS